MITVFKSQMELVIVSTDYKYVKITRIDRIKNMITSEARDYYADPVALMSDYKRYLKLFRN